MVSAATAAADGSVVYHISLINLRIARQEHGTMMGPICLLLSLLTALDLMGPVYKRFTRSSPVTERPRMLRVIDFSLSHSKSFEMIPFESLDPVSYSHSVLTLTLSCIVSEIT